MWNPYIRGTRLPDGSPRAWESILLFERRNWRAAGQRRHVCDGVPSWHAQRPGRSRRARCACRHREERTSQRFRRCGRYRGGLGQTIHIGSRAPGPFSVQAMFDRIQHPALGRKGGLPGAAGRCQMLSGAPIAGMGLQEIPEGDVLVLDLPGGAGHGDPRERDIEAVRDDIENGYVSLEAAERVYGFVPTTPGVDSAEPKLNS